MLDREKLKRLLEKHNKQKVKANKSLIELSELLQDCMDTESISDYHIDKALDIEEKTTVTVEFTSSETY